MRAPLSTWQPSASTSLELDIPRTGPGDNAEAIRAAAREFEAVFMHQVFKSMRATVPKEGLGDAGFGGEVFTDMLDQEYARMASTTGQLGLADTLAEQLGAPREAPPPPTAIRRVQAVRAYGSAGGWLRPVEGPLSSGFGPRQLDGAEPRDHRGVDLAAPAGAPIRAAKAGTVAFAGPRGTYGDTVILDHGDGLTSLYAHARSVAVAVGDEVPKGAVIAEVGTTGRSTGPHLHFEIRRDGEAIDPTAALRIAR